MCCDEVITPEGTALPGFLFFRTVCHPSAIMSCFAKVEMSYLELQFWLDKKEKITCKLQLFVLAFLLSLPGGAGPAPAYCEETVWIVTVISRTS